MVDGDDEWVEDLIPPPPPRPRVPNPTAAALVAASQDEYEYWMKKHRELLAYEAKANVLPTPTPDQYLYKPGLSYNTNSPISNGAISNYVNTRSTQPSYNSYIEYDEEPVYCKAYENGGVNTKWGSWETDQLWKD